MPTPRKKFTVSVPALPGVSDGQWAEHIKTAVERWGGGGSPEDWSFNFGKVSVLKVVPAEPGRGYGYTPAVVPTGVGLLPCPFCGSPAELQEYNDGHENISKVVCCSNSGGSSDDGSECQMYLPSQAAYRATKKDAIAMWNNRGVK